MQQQFLKLDWKTWTCSRGLMKLAETWHETSLPGALTTVKLRERFRFWLGIYSSKNNVKNVHTCLEIFSMMSKYGLHFFPEVWCILDRVKFILKIIIQIHLKGQEQICVMLWVFWDLTPPIPIAYKHNTCNYVSAICLQRINDVAAMTISVAHLRWCRSKKGTSKEVHPGLNLPVKQLFHITCFGEYQETLICLINYCAGIS